MSVCVYPLRADQRLRLGAQWQLRAVAPFNDPKLWRAPWQLNRLPLTFAGITRNQWRPDMELPPDLVELAPDFAAGPRAPSGGGAARGAACPQTMCYAFTIAPAPGGPATMGAASTPAIPWPFRIVSLSINVSPQGLNDHFLFMQLFMTDTEYTVIQADSPEPRLVENIANSSAALNFFGLSTHFGDATANFDARYAPGTGIIGKTWAEPGKRLTIGVSWDDGTADEVHGQITLESCAGLQAFDPAAFRPTSRPPAPPPVPVAAPVAPAPVAPAAPALPDSYVSTGTCLKNVTSGGFPLAFWRQRGYTLPLCDLAPAIRDAGPADNPAQATYWAQIMAARGDATRAALFRDMANRMARGYSLTPQQQTYLSSPDAYVPVPQQIFVQSPTGSGFVGLQPLTSTQVSPTRTLGPGLVY